MSIRNGMNKRKLMVDNIIAVILIVILILLTLTFSLFLLMSLMVYPMASLILYGISGTYRGFFNKKMNNIKRVFYIILGIMYILFAIYILTLLFAPTRTPLNYVIYFLSLPIFLIGIGGILKGLIVNVYSPLLRVLNVLIGAITVLFTVIALSFAETGHIFHLFTLLITLTLNGILRAMLYLSEYGLSLNSFKNLKLVWFLMDNVQQHLPQQEENQINP